MHSLKSERRIAPRQARAQQRIENILSATEALLEKGEEVTTSTIANYADIPVGSIYRYFPNVLSIYRSLFENLNGQLHAPIKAQLKETQDGKSWQTIFEANLQHSVQFFNEHPAFGNLLSMMSNPALLDVKREALDSVSELLADRWRAGHDGFHGGDVDHVARTTAQLFTFVEQCYFEQKDAQKGEVSFMETVKALRAYLSLYLKA